MNCKKCGVELTRENWNNSRKEKHDYVCKICERKRARKWYHDNIERAKQYRREYYQKNRDHIRKRSREYYYSHRGGEFSERRNKRKREWQKEKKEKVEEVLGKTCIVCGKKKVLYHEIHGKKHVRYYAYILKHAEDFVCLCYECHNTLHKYNILRENETFNKLVRLLKGEKR